MSKVTILSLVMLFSLFAFACSSKESPVAEAPVVPPPLSPDEEVAVIDTDFGKIKIRLYSDVAPKHVENFKKLVREQFLMLLIDERRAVEAIPELLDRDPDLASRYARNLQHIIEVVGIGGSVSKTRLSEMRHVFERSVAREPSRIVAAGSISALEKAAVRAAKSSKHA